MARVTRIPQGDKSGMSTGLLWGCRFSINADPTKFNMTEGRVRCKTSTISGIITIQDFPIPAITAGIVDDIGTQNSTFFYIDPTVSLTVPQQRFLPLTSLERRTLVELGGAVHVDLATLSDAVSTPTLVTDLASQIHDHFEISPFSIISGNIVEVKAGLMELSKTAGVGQARGRNYEDIVKGWLDPNNPPLPALVTINFVHVVGDGTVFDPSNATIDPDLWDDGTDTPKTIANPDEATNMRLLQFADNGYVLMPGQQKYSTYAAAQTAAQAPIDTEPFIVPPIFSVAKLVYRISVHKAATDSSDNLEFQLYKEF